MTVSRELVDAIVAGVMTRLEGRASPRREPAGSVGGRRVGGGVPKPAVGASDRVSGRRDGRSRSADPPEAATGGPQSLELNVRVVTAEVLQRALQSASKGVCVVRIPVGAIVTPAARDVLKELKLKCVRAGCGKPAPGAASGEGGPLPGTDARHCALVLVQSPPGLLAAWEPLRAAWRREICSDVAAAARWCVAERARGGVSRILLVADDADHAACLANRHASVRAVVVRGPLEVRSAMRRWGANVFCVAPDQRLMFAWRRLLQAVYEPDV
ncbi:MAG: hypothetical protein D6725_06330 [Planctomycetota bacterium]|nr:MAG: hypothetical protein D6725_06330 [Planctomycetota bacterium]